MKIHHIGYLVGDIESAQKHFCDSLGYAVEGSICEDKIQTAKVLFLKNEEESPLIELVSPNGKSSKLSNTLKKFGDGIHHICYETDDIKSQAETMRKNGFLQISDFENAAAFDGRKIVWLMDSKGVLIELLQK